MHPNKTFLNPFSHKLQTAAVVFYHQAQNIKKGTSKLVYMRYVARTLHNKQTYQKSVMTLLYT